MLKTLKSVDYHKELIETQLKGKSGPIGSNVVAPLFFFYILKDFAPMPILVTITLVQIVSFIWRMIFVNKALKILDSSDDKAIHKLLKNYLYTVFINAFLLGIAGMLTLIYAGELELFMYIAVMSAIAAGAMTSLSSVFHALFIYIVVSFSIVVFSLVFIGGTITHYFVAIMIVFFILSIIFSSFRINQSISNNIKQQEELKEKNGNFQHLLDITMEAIVLSDENYNIVDINHSGVILFGVGNKLEAIGKSIIEYVPDYELSKLQSAMQNEKNDPYEIDLKKYNGEIFPVLISSRNMIMDGEKVRIATILDLTQIKHKDQLLIQQSRQAAMGEMIGHIAHQWRQPLNALGLVLQNIHFTYLLDDLSDEFMEKSAEKGKMLTSSMSKTIDDFRDFFKPNKIKEHFKIADIINSAIGLVEGSFKNSNIEIKTNLDEHIEFVGYPSEFSQVVLNILSNAKDALLEHKTEGRYVEVISYLEGTSLFVTISDNAGGIPSDVIQKVFNPYFTTKEEGKGTGIGLYMSKTIVENNMAGKLSVQNSDNGAVFTIVLPKTLAESSC